MYVCMNSYTILKLARLDYSTYLRTYVLLAVISALVLSKFEQSKVLVTWDLSYCKATDQISTTKEQDI